MRTNRVKTADEMYLDIMFAKISKSERATRIAALLKAANASIGEECPVCGSNSIESNGTSEYRCCECDHRFGGEN